MPTCAFCVASHVISRSGGERFPLCVSLDTVNPMHEACVEPTKRYANVILPEGAFNEAGFDVVLARIWSFVREQRPSNRNNTM